MVPQFIDIEDKIFGPITVRQFVIILVTGGLMFVAFKLLTFWAFVLVGLLLFGVGGTLAFLRVNGMPFHFFLLNIVQTFRRPRLTIWDKSWTTSEVREAMRGVVEAPPPSPPQKEPLESRKLQELSLMVNTGGVYNPDL